MKTEIKATKEFPKKNQKVQASQKIGKYEVKSQNKTNEPIKNTLTDSACRRLSLHECENFKQIPKPRQIRELPVYLDNGKRVKVVVCISGNAAYLVAANYTDECLQEVRRIFRKK